MIKFVYGEVGTGCRLWRLRPGRLWKDSNEVAEERVDREEVLFRDCTGEGVAEDLVLCQFLVQSLCAFGPWVRVAEIAVGRRFQSKTGWGKKWQRTWCCACSWCSLCAPLVLRSG